MYIKNVPTTTINKKPIIILFFNIMRLAQNIKPVSAYGEVRQILRQYNIPIAYSQRIQRI